MSKFGIGRRRVNRKRTTSVTPHFVAHKEMARELVLARLGHFNQFYDVSWNRVAIRNTRTSWGSCSALGNLNFNYKLLFIPRDLADYVIAHELCHLQEFNHGPRFWALLAQVMPDYNERRTALRALEQSRELTDHAIRSRYYVQPVQQIERY